MAQFTVTSDIDPFLHGFLGQLVNSVTSSEGMVLKFSGNGKVIICSRNRENFISKVYAILLDFS